MKIKPAWFEVIPALCGDSFAMSEIGVYIHASKKEVEEEIQDLVNHYREQIAAGEREEGDDEVDFYPQRVLLTDTGRVLDEQMNDITDDVLRVMRDSANITDPSKFIEQIIEYVKGEPIN
ncbi:hypothetical protein [Endozoicomonas atrinae]|uniref:hypothetical protein n=1 Tax=Endozoicomonas atrinae TaxID=1333660 RepID=UPI003AFFF4CC